MFEAGEIDLDVEIKQENVDFEENVLDFYPESVVIEKTELAPSFSCNPAFATPKTEVNERVRVGRKPCSWRKPQGTTSSGIERPAVINYNDSFHNSVRVEASNLSQCFKCKSKNPSYLTQSLIDYSDKGKKYLCQKCVEAFKECLSWRRGSLVYASHYSCYICKARFGGKRDLDTHLAITHRKTQQTVHKALKFQCPMCICAYNDRSHLIKHIKVHTNKTVGCFKCESADSISVVNDSTSTKMYLCDKCIDACKEGLSARDGEPVYLNWLSTRLNLKQKTHKYICDICKKGYNGKYSLYKHINLVHRKALEVSQENECFTCREKHSPSLTQIVIDDSDNERKRLCKKCLHIFKEFLSVKNGSLVLLNRHSSKNEQTQYFCDTCRKGFNEKRHLKIHVTRIHRKTTTDLGECFKCRSRHSSSDARLITDASDNKTKLLCVKCLDAFKACLSMKDDSLVFFNRISSEEGSSQYSCGICRQGFNKIQDLHDHINHMHRKTVTVKCFKCKSKPSLSDAQLITDASDNEMKHLCKKCLDKFKNCLSVRDASLVFLNGYFCDICDDVYVNETLKGHMARAHPDLRKRVKFSCSVCNRAYSSPSYLKRHMEKHGKKKKRKSFACDRCDAVFSTEKNIASHMMWNHECEILTFPCSHCERTFKSISCLERHLKVSHEPSKDVTFPCGFCERVFGSKKLLFIHGKAIHPKRIVERNVSVVHNIKGRIQSALKGSLDSSVP